MAANLQSLLRFLSQDAKIPLATAMSKVKELQAADLDSPEKLSKTKADVLQKIFPEDKQAKQVIAAAKRVSKKRAAGDDGGVEPVKKKKRKESVSLFSDPTAEDLEISLELPTSNADVEELEKAILFTNRAPLVLAFLVVLLKHTMPEQPLSSRLSLAQGYVSVTSRSRAIYLGIESGQSAEDEGFGAGQPVVRVAGKDIKVLRRWGYEWKREGEEGNGGLQKKDELKTAEGPQDSTESGDSDEKPALWALDLEALKKSGNDKQPAAVQAGTHSNLPIYTPQSARAYLLKSFDTAPNPDAPKGKTLSAAAKAAQKEENLGKLLLALDMLYDSWAKTLTPEELDGRTWTWYVKVRPAVADGAAGWGGKNELKLADILALRPET